MNKLNGKIEEVFEVKRLSLKDNDIVVFKSDSILSDQSTQRIKTILEKCFEESGFKNVQAIILDRNIDLISILEYE